MNPNIFEILPDSFFSLLASPNKRIYADCIFLFYRSTNELLAHGIERETLVNIFSDYFSKLSEDALSVFYEEDKDDEKSIRGQANKMIRKLLECGWIFKEENANYVETLHLHDYAISFIETMESLLKNERLEYQGYIYTIYNLLYGQTNAYPSIVLEQVYDNTKRLVNGLKTLNSNIKKYIEKVLKMKTPKEILELQFDDHMINFVDKGGYLRLKTSDNVSKYRPFIIEKLEGYSNDQLFIGQVSQELVNTNKMANLEEAYLHVRQMLNEIIYAFNHIDDIIREIDRKNSQYIRTSMTRIKYLLNSSKDIEGQINIILKYIVNKFRDNNLELKHDYLEEIIPLFGIFPQSFLDNQSLYVAHEGRGNFASQPIEDVFLTEEERLKRIEEFKERNRNRLTKTFINEYVDNLLGDKEVINASQIPFSTIRDFLIIIYIRLYASSKHMIYRIKKLDNYISINGYYFRDFEIWRSRRIK